jgi:hypothetical protein
MASEAAEDYEAVLEFVGIDRNTLTADQRAKLKAFVDSHKPGDILRVRVYPNLDTASDDDVPTGMQVVYSPNARVDPTTIHDNLFQVLAVAEVVEPSPAAVEERMRVMSARDKEAAINAAVPQYADQPYAASLVKVGSNKERAPWTAELGGPGSFAGIFPQLDNEDHRQRRYHVAARATVARFVQDLKAALTQTRDNVTYGDLLRRSEWSSRLDAGTRGAKRNAELLMAQTAEAFGVGTEFRQQDLSYCLPDGDCAPPERVVPDTLHVTHSIRWGTHEGQPAVLVSYGIVPAEDCLNLTEEKFYVVGNPHDGIAVFRLPFGDKIRSAAGVPADTGRRAAVPVATKMAASLLEQRARGLTWETKAIKGAAHPDLHPDAFRSTGEDFRRAMKQIGWDSERHVEKLIPEVVKIWTPDVKRT